MEISWCQDIGHLLTQNGELIFISLTSLILTETILLTVKNREYMMGETDEGEENKTNERGESASEALNLAALTFAVISLIVSGFHKNLSVVEDTLAMFSFALFLFIISFKMDGIVATRRLYSSIQKRLFNYGILSLISGITFLFTGVFHLYCSLILPSLVVIAVIHIWEFKSDYEDVPGRLF